MKSKKKSSKSEENEVFNTELIYSRVMCLLSIGRITLEDVVKYELPPIMLSLFENTGEMRASKSKSDLKRVLSVETVLRLQSKPNVVITYGCVQLWLHHGRLTALLRTWLMLFITLFCHTELQT